MDSRERAKANPQRWAYGECNKVQVEILTPSGKTERRNYFVAGEQGGFDDYDVRPVQAWRPLPTGTEAEPYRDRARRF